MQHSRQPGGWRSRQNLSGDGIVAGEGVLDVVGGDSAETADAPVIPFEFDNRGRHDGGSLAGVENEREAIAELVEDFFPAGAGGRVGDVGAGAGKWDANFGDEIRDDSGFGPTKGDAAGVGGDFEGEAVGGVDDDGERAGPTGFGETIKIVGKFARKHHGVIEIADEDGKGAVLGAPLDAEDLLDGGKINGIGGEGVEGIGGYGYNSTAVEPGRSIADDMRVGIGRADFEDLSRQAVPYLF